MFVKDNESISLFHKSFGFKPNDIEILNQAFKHKSLANKVNNERLEFLGDSVLSTVVAEHICKTYPDGDEGFLSKLRSKIVNRESLNKISFEIGLDKFLVYDKKSKLSVKNSPDIFGNAFEAFIGAIYLDKGFYFVKKYILEEIIKKYINLETVINTEINYKGRLIEIVQKENLTIEFKTEETRDDEVPFYFTKIFIDGKECGIGNGFKKIKSEQEAAENAYLNLKKRNE